MALKLWLITPPRWWSTTSGGSAAWVYAYVVVQLLSQLALLAESLAGARVFIRSAALGTSLLFLVVAPGRTRDWGIVRARYEEWVRLALAEAGTAPGHGDVPIGAVVVDEGVPTPGLRWPLTVVLAGSGAARCAVVPPPKWGVSPVGVSPIASLDA